MALKYYHHRHHHHHHLNFSQDTTEVPQQLHFWRLSFYSYLFRLVVHVNHLSLLRAPQADASTTWLTTLHKFHVQRALLESRSCRCEWEFLMGNSIRAHETTQKVTLLSAILVARHSYGHCYGRIDFSVCIVHSSGPHDYRKGWILSRTRADFGSAVLIGYLAGNVAVMYVGL